MDILTVEYEAENNEIFVDGCEGSNNLTLEQLEVLFDQVIETIKQNGSHN